MKFSNLFLLNIAIACIASLPHSLLANENQCVELFRSGFFQTSPDMKNPVIKPGLMYSTLVYQNSEGQEVKVRLKASGDKTILMQIGNHIVVGDRGNSGIIVDSGGNEKARVMLSSGPDGVRPAITQTSSGFLMVSSNKRLLTSDFNFENIAVSSHQISNSLLLEPPVLLNENSVFVLSKDRYDFRHGDLYNADGEPIGNFDLVNGLNHASDIFADLGSGSFSFLARESVGSDRLFVKEVHPGGQLKEVNQSIGEAQGIKGFKRPLRYQRVINNDFIILGEPIYRRFVKNKVGADGAILLIDRDGSTKQIVALPVIDKKTRIEELSVKVSVEDGTTFIKITGPLVGTIESNRLNAVAGTLIGNAVMGPTGAAIGAAYTSNGPKTMTSNQFAATYKLDANTGHLSLIEN